MDLKNLGSAADECPMIPCAIFRRILFVTGLAGLVSTGWAQTASLQVSSTSLSFNAIANGPKPATQFFNVTSSDSTTLDFALLVDAGSPGALVPWLAVTPLLATTPAQIRVSIDQTGLTAGANSARIQLTDRQGRLFGVVINVALRVTAGTTQLNISPSQVVVSNSVAAGTVQQGLLVRNLGPGALAPVTVTVVSGFPWLRGTVTACDSVCVISVGVVVGTLSPGPHNGLLRITTAIGSQDVPVTVFAGDHGAFVQLTSDAVQFEALQSSGLSDSHRVSLLNTGDAPLIWTAEVTAGNQWLSVSPPTDITNNGKSSPITLTANVGSLSPGTYGGMLRINSLDATASSYYLPVVFKVSPSNATVAPVLSTGGLLFSADLSGETSQLQDITLTAASTTAMNYQIAPQSPGWLSIAPSRGTAVSSLPTILHVTGVAVSLQTGFYAGLANVAFGTAVRTLHGGFSVMDSKGGRCFPQTLHLTETAIPDGFVASAGYPLPLEAILVDDCGNPISNALVSAAFSTGDPSLFLQPIGGGHYVATWIPANVPDATAGPAVSITLRAYSPPLAAISNEVIGSVIAGSAPAIASGGVLNNLSPQLGAPIAPAGIVQIFGSGLASSTLLGVIVNGVLAANLGGVSVKIGGLDAPLYYASSGQINAQVPAELQPNQRYQVIVNVNGVYSKPEFINTTPVQPGIATFQDGKAIAQDLNFNLIDAQHPAHPGDIIVLYLTGMGPTNPIVPSGVPAPGSPLAVTNIQPLITIDSAPADVIFSGLTPGAVGLYQIDVRIPSNAKIGDLPLVVKQGDAVSNTALVPVR